MIDIAGSTVAIDGMGCQKAIVQEILIQRADYVSALKENQQKLYEMVGAIFNMGGSWQFKKMLNRCKVEKVHEHGRVEARCYTLVSAKGNTN